MNISDISSGMSANSVSAQSTILMAKKSLDMQKQDGVNTLALIQSAAPNPGNGNGKLVNLQG